MKPSLQIIIIFSLIFSLTTIGLSADEHQHSAGKKLSAAEKIHSDHEDHKDHDHPADHSEPEEPAGEHEDDHHDAAATKPGSHEHEHEEGEAGVKLSPTQLATAAIKVEVLEYRNLSTEIYTPGELKANDYTSYLVSPRTDSVVLKRHVALGDHIEEGQPLVTLFAETVAAAQAEFLVVREEWQRVQKMGRKTVGAKRYIRAEMDYKAAYSRLKIFGLDAGAIKNTAANSTTLGEYTLKAVISGTVLRDDFQQGQRVAAGEELLQLADERNLWAEAYLTPNLTFDLAPGTKARIMIDNRSYPAVVSQQEHTINSLSRTRTVRLLVDNEKHKLHPGMFVDVYLSLPASEPVLAVPETALMRGGDGDWTIFIEEKAGEYQAHEVDRGRTFGNLQEITGVAAGSRVVVEGAFFIASQLAKGGFDPHNH